MSLIATAVLTLWPLAVLAMFGLMRPERAALVAYILGWMFLPLVELNVPGIPAYGKSTATSLVLIPCVMLFDGNRLLSFTPSLIDLPIIFWCVAPILSSLSNGLGLYDGLSGFNSHVLLYAAPYFVGRLYLNRPENWVFLTKLLTLCAIVYVPLCMFEMRMGPTLHRMLYGVNGRASYELNEAFGPLGWAPTVFMNSAFEVNMLMVAVTLVAFWGWQSGVVRKLYGIDIRWLFTLFLIQSVLCKKWSGMGLMMVGLAVMFASRKLQTISLPFVLAILPVTYMASFATGVYRGEGLFESIAEQSERRAQSFQFRLDNDAMLIEKAMQRPVFGWGGWGRNRIYNDEGKDISITDSAFGIYLGIYGIFGLTAVSLLYLLPFLALIYRFPPRQWTHLPVVLVVPFALIICLHMYDNLFNAFSNVVYPMFAGGTVSTAVAQSHRRLQST